MGYLTDFDGVVEIYPPLTPEHRAYINQFSMTRRIRRNPTIAESMVDPIRLAAGLPIGTEGAYSVIDSDGKRQDNDDSIIEYNTPPTGQPSLYCNWAIPDAETLAWDGNDKFDEYGEWLVYLIEHFFKPWKYRLDGVITFQGDAWEDYGQILIEGNKVLRGYCTLDIPRKNFKEITL